MKRNYAYVAVISCVILMVCALSGCQNAAQQEPKVEQVQESTRIDSGMLVTYDGENTDLTVSDTVTKVDADLFKETKSPEEVTHIVLGAGVEEISPKSGCSADVYILTSSGDRVDSDSWGVNDGALSFYLGEDSELRYEKIGYDYCDFEQYESCPGGIDGNATYSEEGVASVANGKLVLTADKTCTVSDYWNIRGTNG